MVHFLFLDHFYKTEILYIKYMVLGADLNGLLGIKQNLDHLLQIEVLIFIENSNFEIFIFIVCNI